MACRRTASSSRPSRSTPFLDNSKTGGIERMACLPELKWFDVNTVKSDATSSASQAAHGKSFFLRDLMFNLSGTFPGGIVISQTDRLNGYWKQYIRSASSGPSTTRARAAGKEDPVDPRFFVLLDDVISDARLRYDEALNELFVAGATTKS
eukprot:tig00021013_g17034.t1